MYESCVAPHRVRFDISNESVVAVCSCGRRAVAGSLMSAAALMRTHLAGDIRRQATSRLLRKVA